jgi:hypothetical protein
METARSPNGSPKARSFFWTLAAVLFPFGGDTAPGNLRESTSIFGETGRPVSPGNNDTFRFHLVADGTPKLQYYS